MAAKLVDTKQTQYTQYELTKAFVEAWKELFGVTPVKKQIAVIWAQNALETGMSASMWNNNIGNVKHVAKPTDTEEIQYCMLKNVWEIVNGKKVIFQPPHPATWFRSFPTLKEGVHHHFNFLKNKRYRIAWAAVESGDPVQFAKLLKQQGYYTAPVEDYIKAEKAYFDRFMKADYFEKAIEALTPKVEPKPIEPAPVPDFPIVHPPVDFPTLDTPLSPDEPLKLTKWQKIFDFLTKPFKK